MAVVQAEARSWPHPSRDHSVLRSYSTSEKFPLILSLCLVSCKENEGYCMSLPRVFASIPPLRVCVHVCKHKHVC